MWPERASLTVRLPRRDVPSLFDANFIEGKSHRLHLGATDEIPFLKNQERLTFARVGITDPVNVEDYRTHAGFRGLEKALDMSGIGHRQ